MDTQQIPQEQMINLWAFGFLLAVMILGAFLHWVKKRYRGELQGNFIAYLLADKPGSTSLAYGSMFFTSLAIAYSSAASFIDPRLLWELLATTGSLPATCMSMIGGTFWAGWGMDSGLNKGAS
jgi:hypothetical protein